MKKDERMNNLSIEFRAIPFGKSIYHALEYRFSPNQDRTYTSEFLIFNFFKLRLKRKFSTKWRKLVHFNGWWNEDKPDSNDSWYYSPVLIKDYEELTSIRQECKTYKDLVEYIETIEAPLFIEWSEKLKNYSEQNKIWY